MPLVSILLPYYNNEKYVFKTINSVLKQTYKRFELIIIFDEYLKIKHNVLNPCFLDMFPTVYTQKKHLAKRLNVGLGENN